MDVQDADHNRYPVARIGVDIIGTETRLHQLGGGIAFPERPLTGTEHTNIGRILLQCILPLLCHHIKSLIPADRGKLTLLVILVILVIFAVLLTQQRLGQTILAVHDLGEEVPLDTVQPLVDRCIGVTLSGYHMPLFGTYQYATTGTTESTGRLAPSNIVLVHTILGECDTRNGNPCRCCGCGNCVGLIDK